ncbi:hypothetical protein H072_6321 [Dactylellina haptotyla CBS 200.50]|uniref:Uncharacterized protein n=1 Tax=Dactylellina haptotyla (strain CBS 200.50) TaxID=1284197 RepID=S8AFD2_DACHA|nr:hypothetical protein H072_6321 [Dactylellina haptotyla CBS 200.50]
MGFLELGKRSIPSRREKAARKRATTNDAGATLANDTLDLAPTSTFRTTPFERLPIEILQRIFLFSYNPDFPLVNRFFLSILSSPYLVYTLVSSAVLDKGLSQDEYQAILSTFIARRFFSLEFMYQLEESLWDQYFKLEVNAKYPYAEDNTPPESADGRISRMAKYSPNPESLDSQVEIILSETEYRVIFGKLDLEGTIIPYKKMLEPPYTVARIEIAIGMVKRMHHLLRTPKAGSSIDRLIEIAIRKRCAAMVYFLVKEFHFTLEPRHVRAALVPTDLLESGWLEPEISRGHIVSMKEDAELFKVFDRAVNSSGLEHMRHTYKQLGQLQSQFAAGDKAWSEPGLELEGSLRVFWAMLCLVPVGSDEEESIGWMVHGKETTDFPANISRAGVFSDKVVWNAAIKNKTDGSLLRFLMRVGTPAAGLGIL